jgi:hypothetical protein
MAHPLRSLGQVGAGKPGADEEHKPSESGMRASEFEPSANQFVIDLQDCEPLRMFSIAGREGLLVDTSPKGRNQCVRV